MFYFFSPATLTLYHGRVSGTGANTNEVEGVAVLNLGGTAMISHFFDCYTSVGSVNDLRWSREEGTQRFPTTVVGPFVIDGVSRMLLRLNLAPIEGGVIRPVMNSDVGIYICSSPEQSVSINITGGEPT